MTEIPDSLRKAVDKLHKYRWEANGTPHIDIPEERLLQFIHSQREEAVREVIASIRCGFPKAKDKEEHHHNMKVISWALDEIDEYLRAKFLPTSLTPEKHE